VLIWGVEGCTIFLAAIRRRSGFFFSLSL
jgi:hypothetical protein